MIGKNSSPETYLISTQSYRHEKEDAVEIPTQYGYLVETDFKGYQRLLSVPTPTESPYGERIKPGLRGLHLWNGKIYVASWNTIHIADYESFQLVDSFSHPLMSDLHGIYVDEQGIWATSSLIDSILQFDWQWELKGVLAVPGTRLYPWKIRHAVDLSADYRLRGKVRAGMQNFHANHITPYDHRYVLVTGRGDLPGGGRVILVNRQNMHYRLWAKRLEGPHDGLFIRPDCFAVTETDTSSVALVKPPFFWPPAQAKSRYFLPTGEKKFWTRGLCLGPENSLLIGRSVWKGGDGEASVVHLDQDGMVIAEHVLEIEDYPECRIFQIFPVPSGD